MPAWQPRGGFGVGSTYPFDFDGSERQVRFKTGTDPKPYPPIIGSISGFLPQMDWRVWGQGYGRKGYGPTWQSFPINLQWQMTVASLNKQTGGTDS